MAKELVAAKQAAIEAEVHSQQIYVAVNSGLLTAVRKGGRTLITRESLDRWKQNLLTKRRIREEECQRTNGGLVQASA